LHPSPAHPPAPPPASSSPSAIRRIVNAWRTLSGGAAARDHVRRTLIACSAGTDSSALAIALAAALGARSRELLVVAHVVHDLRPPREALADRDLSRKLAQRLGLAFSEASIRVREHTPANPEGVARRLRYQALATLAHQHACAFIATAHHADDQFETMLMRLIRGAGPRGLAGIAPRRTVRTAAGPIRVIRPMLCVDRAQARAICDEHAWTPAHDQTNADTSRLRAFLRERVLPALRERDPGVATRVADRAQLYRHVAHALRDGAIALDAATARVGEAGPAWSREALALEAPAVLGEWIRRALASRGVGEDALGWPRVRAIARAIRDHRDDRREFAFRCPGQTNTEAVVALRVDATRVLIV
jgi:tRNA(Ile)-lysidine synthase